MKLNQNVIYYKDELKDEFSAAKITPKVIDGTYRYDDPSFHGRVKHRFWYHIVARPIARIFLKVKFHHKIVNKEVLKVASGQGYFMYGNHTNAIADALIPSMLSYPADAEVIVHANNVSMPYLGAITPYLGALPLPDDKEATKKFIKIIEKRIHQGHSITIYPEAHIWPYYTGIRPYLDTSFRYPVQMSVPTFCFTNTYHKRKFSKTPQIITYVDGPFYGDHNLTAKQQKQVLREEVYQTMKNRSKNNTVQMITYIKAGDSK